jgi:5'-3' exonuclease
MGKGAGKGAGKGFGIEDLSPSLRKFGSDPSGHLREFAGKKVAVDVSHTLHAALRSHAATNQCHASPEVEITAIIPYLRGLCDIYEKFGVAPIMVFDGVYHPGKERIDIERAAKATEAASALAAMYSQAARNEGDYAKMMALRTSSTRVTAPVTATAVKYFQSRSIEVRGSAFEADFDCVRLEQTCGDVMAVQSNDSDLYCLGAQALIIDLNRETGACHIVRRGVNEKDSKIGQWPRDQLIAYCCFLGNDFIRRVHGNAQGKAEALASKWHAAIGKKAKGKVLGAMDGKKWNKGGGKVVNYAVYFNHAFGLLKHAPVFDGGDGAAIVPLNPLPAGQVWKSVVGFDPVALYTEKSPLVAAAQARGMTGSCRFNCPLTLPLKPVHPVTGAVLDYGAVVDMGAGDCPPRLQPTAVLVDWLAWRSVPIPANDRDQIVSTVERALRGEALALREDLGVTHHSHYSSWEMVASRGEWFSPQASVDYLRGNLALVDAAMIDTEFGTGKNGLRLRAVMRFESGSLNVDSLRMSLASLASGERRAMIETECTPSMKSVNYSVKMLFKHKQGGGCTFDAKHSCCDCPDGRHFCSHMLAALLLIRVLQNNPEWTLDDVRQRMAEPIKTIQGLPLSFALVFGEMMQAERKGKGEATKAKRKHGEIGEGGGEGEEVEGGLSDDGGDGSGERARLLRSLGREYSGYTVSDDAGESDQDAEARARVEADSDNNSRDICAAADAHIAAAEKRGSKPLYTETAIREHNTQLVEAVLTPAEEKLKAIQQELIYRKMQAGLIEKEGVLVYQYLNHPAHVQARKELLRKHDVPWVLGGRRRLYRVVTCFIIHTHLLHSST